MEDSTKKYPQIKTEIPGPKSLAFFNEGQNDIAPGIQTIATRSKIAIGKDEGCFVYDVDNSRCIDFFVSVADNSATEGPNEKPDKKYTELVFHECLKHGLIGTSYNADIRVCSRLIINKEIAEEGIHIMEEAIAHGA